MRFLTPLLALICLNVLSVAQVHAQTETANGKSGWQFTLTFDSAIHPAPFTGRVFLFFSNSGDIHSGEPRFGPNWFHPQPFLSYDVRDWNPDSPLQLTLATPGLNRFPEGVKDEDLINRSVQAIARFNTHVPDVGTGEGNGMSRPVPLATPGEVKLNLSSLTPPQEFPAEAWSKLMRIRSTRLSEFHGRDVFLQAAITVPASYYSDKSRRYPVILEIPGFGGDHFYKLAGEPVKEQNSLGVEFIRVMLDPKCPLGHHVFANSANNGPYGDAFVSEFLPALDESYRTVGATGRYLTGHSSGGWSTLWLQINYPQQFSGTWSTAPDPVDFRDFQRINVYEPGMNMYVDETGARRPLGRINGTPIIFYDTFSQMEDVLGPGGQLNSFEAVFSPRGQNGKPLPLWDRETGKIDPDVAEHWKRFDIRLIIARDWKVLAPHLQGKLQVFMGMEDTFYLEGAAVLLKEALESVGSDAVIELVPGRDHRTLIDQQLLLRIEQEMAAKFLQDSRDRLQNPD